MTTCIISITGHNETQAPAFLLLWMDPVPGQFNYSIPHTCCQSHDNVGAHNPEEDGVSVKTTIESVPGKICDNPKNESTQDIPSMHNIFFLILV